jgi:hypothetical protein
MALSGGIDFTQDRVLTDPEKLTNPKINEATTFTARLKENSVTSRELADAFSVEYFDTVADFRANTAAIADGTTVAISGYWTAGAADAGPPFTVYPSDTTTADDGGSCLVDANGLRIKRTFAQPVNVRWFGAKGDDSWTTPANDDSTAVENATIVASAASVPVYWPGGIYRITRQILKSASDETPVVKTFKWVSEFNEKQNQFVEEDSSNLEKIRVAIIFDAAADTEWLFRALDYGAGSSGNYYYGPYEIDGFIFKLTQGNGFQFGGVDASGSYDPTSNNIFCFGVRIRNSYLSGTTGCITLDGSNELLVRTTDQRFVELVRGYECELENLSVRGGSYQIQWKNCDNLKIDRVRSQQGFMPLKGLSNNAVMASVTNFQFEGFHGAGFYCEDAKFDVCRFENGYGTPYKVNRYQAKVGATGVDASITAGSQYISLTNLSGNEPSDFFEPYMPVTIDDGTRTYLLLVTAVDDDNDRLEFANYDSYSRFNATVTNADIYRHFGVLGVMGEDTCTLTDSNGSYNNNESTSIDNNPQFVVVPGKQPHCIKGFTAGLGDNNKYSNRIAVAAHSYGKQYDLYGGLHYSGSSPHLAPDADHPLVNFSGMAIHQDLANARSEYVENPQLSGYEWLMTPKNHISVDNSAANTYFEQVSGVWCWHKHAGTNIDLAPQLPEFPEGAGVYEVEVLARAVSGSSTTNIRVRNSTPTSEDIITSAAIDTTWRVYRGIIIDPTSLNEGASRKYIEVAGPAEMYVQYVKFRKLDRPTDVYESEFVLLHRSDGGSTTIESEAVGDTFELEETGATYQITYDSVSYTDGQSVTFAASPTSFATDSGTGYLWNTKRKFTPGVPGWLYAILDFNDADPVVCLERVMKLGSSWYIAEEYRHELGSVTSTSPFSIDSSTGEITIEESAGATVRTNCKYAFSIDRKTAERIYEYYN